MTKLYRVVSYVLDLNKDYKSNLDLKSTIESHRHPEFHSVKDIKCVDIGDWDDNHPLNKKSSDNSVYESYFPEIKNDSSKVSKELNTLRDENLDLKSKNSVLLSKVDSLEKLIEKYNDIEDLLNKIKEKEQLYKKI